MEKWVEILVRVAVTIAGTVKWLDVGDKVCLCCDDAKSLINGGDAKEIKAPRAAPENKSRESAPETK